MPIPKDYPLESFDPRIKDLLIRGATEEFEIQCKSVAEAHKLQFMLNSYRKRMRKEYASQPELWKPLFFTVVGRLKDANGKLTKLHIYSRHHEFDEALSSIKPLEPQKLTHDPLEDLTDET